jgi:WD40 repeat protein
LVKIWNVSDGQLIKTLSPSIGEVRGLQFSPDGLCVAASGEGVLKLWRISDGALLQSFNDPYTIIAMAISPDGSKIACGTKEINIWDINSGLKINTLYYNYYPYKGIWSIAFNPTKNEIIAGCGSHSDDSQDTYLRIWDLDSLSMDSINNSTILSWNVRYNFDGHYIVSTTDEYNCYIYSDHYVRKYSFKGEEIAFKPNTNWLSIAYNNDFKFFNVDRNISSKDYPSGQEGMESIDFSINNVIATGSYDKTVKLWSVVFKWIKEE